MKFFALERGMLSYSSTNPKGNSNYTFSPRGEDLFLAIIFHTLFTLSRLLYDDMIYVNTVEDIISQKSAVYIHDLQNANAIGMPVGIGGSRTFGNLLRYNPQYSLRSCPYLSVSIYIHHRRVPFSINSVEALRAFRLELLVLFSCSLKFVDVRCHCSYRACCPTKHVSITKYNTKVHLSYFLLISEKGGATPEASEAERIPL